ncbi:unnamed protein product, partial [marine sediment metagenome]
SDFDIDETSNVTRKWYLTVNVSNGSLNAIEDVNIVVYENSTGTWNVLWSRLTDSNGLVSSEPTAQYLKNYSGQINYTLNITASKASYYSNHTIIDNLIADSQVNLTLMGGVADTTSPIITIDSPTNNAIYNTTWVMLNITTNEACENATYSLNGTANISLSSSSSTKFYKNLTGLADNSTYNITFWANDTSGNWGQSSLIYFTINTSYGQAEEETKSMINNTGTTNFKGYLTLKVQKNSPEVVSSEVSSLTSIVNVSSPPPST